MNMELSQFFTPLIGLTGTVVGIVLSKVLNRKKDTTEYQSRLLEDLWKEIGRLQEKAANQEKIIESLVAGKQKSEEKEQELQKRIAFLEHENRHQASEIKELRRKLNEKPGKNV